jgi:hypothetical protein
MVFAALQEKIAQLARQIALDDLRIEHQKGIGFNLSPVDLWL